MLELAGGATQQTTMRLNCRAPCGIYDLINIDGEFEEQLNPAKRNGINILTSNSFVRTNVAKSLCLSR